jgi:hypothetical protein
VAVIWALAFVFVLAGRRRSGDYRAMLVGTGTGLAFGIEDGLTRRTVQITDVHSVTTLLSSWPAYALVVNGIAALWLMESAFSAAPLRASLPAITAAEPVAGILLGVVIFGDTIRVSPGMLALQAAGIVALVIGVVIVGRAPALSSLREAAAAQYHPRPGARADPPAETGDRDDHRLPDESQQPDRPRP